MKTKLSRVRICRASVNASYIAIINALNKNGATLYNIKKTENGLEFGISTGDMSVLRKICDERDIEFSIVEKSDIKSRINKKGYDLFLFCGMMLAGVLMLLCSLVTLDYTVSDNPVFNYREIKNMGTGCEIYMFRYNSTDKIDRLKELILSSDKVADCDVYKKGNKINVIISASLDPETEEKADVNADVVSLYDAEITKIICRSGTAAFSVGDKVNVGDVLVNASFMVGEQTYAVGVDCEVYGKVTIAENYVFPKMTTEYSFGEYDLCGRSLYIFGKELFSTSLNDGQSETYEKTVDVLGILNIGIRKTYCREMFAKDLILTDEYIRNTIIPQLTEKMHSEYDDRFENVDVEIFEKTVDNNIIIDVYYTGITRIDSGG